MHLVESRSTRVLSTTDEEEQDQRTNLITHQGGHRFTTTHKDIGEDTIDADDQVDQSSDNASQNTQNMVYDIYFFPFNLLFFFIV